MKMPTIIGIFKFISRENFHAQLCLASRILVVSSLRYIILAGQISGSTELSMKKVYNFGALSPYSATHISLDNMLFSTKK